MQKINPELPYQPVSCDLHSQYELAIIHKSKLQLVYKTENNSTIADVVTPIDVQIKNKAEYLIALSSANKNLYIRLDYILEIHTLNKV